MRQGPDFFEHDELELIYVAKKLKEALALEEALDQAQIDYLVEPDKYSGGIIFRTERVGAFFYVPPARVDAARQVVTGQGYEPYKP
jgi:hypothetical protein